MSTRLVALLLAAPLALAPAASADPTVPGCWGAGASTYCDATVRVDGGDTGTSPTPVCAYTCVYVGVPTTSDPRHGTYQACVDYTTPSGAPGSRCTVEIAYQDVNADAKAVLTFVLCTARPVTFECED